MACDGLKEQILSVVLEYIHTLDKLSWNINDINQREASVFLGFPLMYWCISDTQDKMSYRVFAHGIKLLFRYNDFPRNQKTLQYYEQIHSVKDLIKFVHAMKLREIFTELSKFPDEDVRIWVKFSKCFSFKG